MSGQGGGTVTVASAPPADAGGAAPGEPRLHRYAARALGSPLRLTVALPPDAAAAALVESAVADRAADAAWTAVGAEFDAVDRALSRFRDDSELTRLNRVAGTGAVVRVSWRLRRMLVIVDRAERLTGGRFDASVLADLERIGEHGADLRPPDGAPVGDDAAAAQGSLVTAPAVPVDSGGIGKGLALRWARDRALATLPPGSGLLLDAGGDLVTGGTAPDGGWRIGIEDPAAPDPDAVDPVVVVTAASGAVATSSVRVRHWRAGDGRPVHHLVDPRTREPARTGLLAVTVAAPDPAWAEVWTKALFLAGRRGIGDEARARGLAAWWVDDRGRLGMTPGARERTAWADEARLG